MLNEHRIFRAVRMYDEAIDWHAMGGVEALVSWLREGRPFDRLVFRPGARPVVFHLRHIPVSLAHRAILPGMSIEQKRARAFRASCIRIENLRAPGDLWEPARALAETTGAPLADLYADHELDHIRDAQAIEEIGDVAHALAFFPMSIPPMFEPLPMSARIWDTLDARRRAAQASTTPEDGSQGVAPAGS